MKVLYIFPHPDDESFGPAPAMVKQRRDGHEVYLLTLTKGGATKQREKFGYTVSEMGEVRFEEMKNVAKVLNLSGMEVLDLPDSGMKEMYPEEIEKVIEEHIEKIKPDVVVTYAVHGISGFHDHLVTHAAVKSVYCRMKKSAGYLKRRAFFTLSEEDAAKQKHFRISGSKDDEIDIIETADDSDIVKVREALDCYVTFKATIDASDIKNQLSKDVKFEIFKESYSPKLKNIFDKL